MNKRKVTVSAPGRICLFGEHQDYLGLPVLPMAINLRINIQGTPRPDNVFRIDMPDINEVEEFDFPPEADLPRRSGSAFGTDSQPIKYTKARDYLRSGVNVLLRDGVRFSHGYNCLMKSTIPIKAGTSSSSALCTAWIKFLLTIANDRRKDKPAEITRFAHRTEVLEFKEPGGMMDHLASAFGSLIFVRFHPDKDPKVDRLPAKLGDFVLGDSLQPKDTLGILKHVKGGVLEAAKILSEKNPRTPLRGAPKADPPQAGKFSLKTAQISDGSKLPAKIRDVFIGAIMNRDIAVEAEKMLSRHKIDNKELGNLLNQHHAVLRDFCEISTPKIERMLQAAMKAGAMGGKINGSGGGGCMFAYCPGKAKAVAKAIEKAGGKAYIIKMSAGASED